MKILTRKDQKKILSKIIELDNILDDYTEAKVKALPLIADIVAETTGIDGLLTMRDYCDLKAYRQLGYSMKEAGEDNE